MADLVPSAIGNAAQDEPSSNTLDIPQKYPTSVVHSEKVFDALEFKKKETILCFRDRDISQHLWIHSYKTIMQVIKDHGPSENILDSIFRGSRGLPVALDRVPAWMIPRDLAEEDPYFRQLIPYVVVINESQEILTYRRSKASGEDRLHDKYSIGVGGHINSSDVEALPELTSGVPNILSGQKNEFKPEMILPSSMLENAFRREMQEELKFDVVLAKKVIPQFLIRLNDTPVDRVHLGVVIAVVVSRSDSEKIIQNVNHELDEPMFRPMALMPPRENLEMWSQACMDFLAVPKVLEQLVK